MKVGIYKNKSMCLKLKNKKEVIELTLNLKDALLGGELVAIDPDVADSIIRLFKKKRIIRKVVSTIDYNNRFAPIVKINLGILKSYDYIGVNRFQRELEVK